MIFGERQRVVGKDLRCVRGQDPDAPAAVEPAARLLPERLERAVGEIRRTHDRPREGHGPAAGRVVPAERDAIPRRPVRSRDRHAAGATAAGTAVEPHGIVDRKVGRRGIEVRAQRIGGDVRHQAEVDGLEIHQQRVGQHVVGAVRLVVECAAVVALRREVAVVDDHVAGDPLDALLAQAGDEAPPPVGRHERIAPTDQHQVALEHPVAHRAGRKGPRAPRVGWPEQLQRRIRREHFHRRRGIARNGRVVAHERLVAAHFPDEDADARARDLLPGQRLLDLGRQVRAVAAAGDMRRKRQRKQAGEDVDSLGHRVGPGETGR